MSKGKPVTKGSVLVIDDEPEYLAWIKEYLEENQLSCEFCCDLTGALNALSRRKYSFILIDMNIPAVGATADLLKQAGPLAIRYPGVALVSRCRNDGYRGYQVIAYTVHDDPALSAEVEDRLTSTYILKSRPQVLKKMIKSNIEGIIKRSS